MAETNPYTDVVELCALLQCLGFNVRSVDLNGINNSQDEGCRTVVISCQSSGLHVVMESASLSCSCPATNVQNSGVWHVSGIAGGKEHDKEFGCSLLCSLPKTCRDRLSKELHAMMKRIKTINDFEVKDKEGTANKSSSMMDLSTPEKLQYRQIKAETPTRYRSLDTLTKVIKEEGALQMSDIQMKRVRNNSGHFTDDDNTENKKAPYQRQSTYTLSSTPGSFSRRNKTSSPVRASETTLLDDLLAAERGAFKLSKTLCKIVKDYIHENRNESNTSWPALDVSKISLLKGSDSLKQQFASSPNLPRLAVSQDEFTKTRLKRFESTSTTSLDPAKPGTSKEGKPSFFRRLSPKIRRAGELIKDPKSSASENKSGLKIPRIITPVRTPQSGQSSAQSSPNLSSSSRKKFSHVKSTIPKRSKKE